MFNANEKQVHHIYKELVNYEYIHLIDIHFEIHIALNRTIILNVQMDEKQMQI